MIYSRKELKVYNYPSNWPGTWRKKSISVFGELGARLGKCLRAEVSPFRPLIQGAYAAICYKVFT